MMSLISAARICIVLLPPVESLLLHGHFPAQTLELGPDRAVVHRAPDIDHHTAQQIRIDDHAGNDVPLVREAAREIEDALLLRGPQRDRAAYDDPQAPDLPVDELFVYPRQVGDEFEPLALRQQ